MSLTFHRLHVPATLEAPGGADFALSAAVSDAVEYHLWGHDDFAVAAEERLVMMQPSPDRESGLWFARDGERIVADARLRLPQRDNLETGYLHIEVLPGYRRRGAARTLLALAEQELARRHRSVIMAWSDARVDDGVPQGPVLLPPTGAGTFPAQDAAAVLALTAGFELVQVDRQSVLDLDAASDAQRERVEFAAAARAGGEYEVLEWTDRCPEELVGDYAVLRARMSTDPPMGGFAQEEEQWDAGRIRREEDKAIAGGVAGLVCAVRHRGSGQLVGHTVMERFASRPAVVYQEDTLVLEEHRGHRLGRWLKSVNLRRLRAAWPTAARVYTWNAEENAFMLDVNTALGFRPSGRTAGWQKVTAPA